MRTLSGGGMPESDKRPDFGDAPICNAKYDCGKCRLKGVGCIHKVNTLNCEIAIMRMRKILDEQADDADMEKEQNNSLKDFLKNLKSTDEEDDD
jgi:hypothetical protein